LELFNLSNLLVNISVMTLSYAGQLVHTAVLKYLIVVLCIHESDCST
jgi:phage shock protein PspC (stress-responsive transcriptional regulator)